MILLLGASGYVGQSFARAMERCGERYLSVSRGNVDYTDLSQLETLIRETQPSFLVNAAGYTGKPNVDACEIHKTQCLAGNAVLPGVIRTACERYNVPWGHVSSGCIYTGRRPDGGGFRETDPPNFSFRNNNCSFYSGCKALGEECLLDAENVYVWRLRIPFNEVDSPRNYLSKLMTYDRLLDAENSLSHLDELVRCSLECWWRRVPFGIYNTTNTGSVTTRRVVELIKKHLQPRKDFQFFESEQQFMKLAAVAPRSNCVLDNSKLVSCGIEVSPVEDALERALRNWTQPPRHSNPKTVHSPNAEPPRGSH